MPVHDWTRVDAGIFHAFHHGWITAISKELNEHLLSGEYYALPEQHAAGFGPDVLTLQGTPDDEDFDHREVADANGRDGGTALLAAPTATLTGESDLEFYRRKQNFIAIRHVSGDRVVAVIEIVSPGNKSSRHAMQSFVEKAAEFLDQRVHLLIVDLFPPGPRDPQGIHGNIWDEIAGQEYSLPAERPLTLAAYEANLSVRAYVKHILVGESLPEMPLFLKPNGCVSVPLEATYQTAFEAMPRRWSRVLER